MSITYQNKYPNVIIFAEDDFEGILASYIVKQKYDNNLQNDRWEKNCWVFLDKKQKLDWYKEKVKQKFVKGQQNVVYMLNCTINPNQDLMKFWNWLTDKQIEFYWVDHHIEAIQNLKHLNIQGKQSSLKSTPVLTWQLINSNTPLPTSLKIINEAVIGQSSYSLEKESLPLCYFIESLGNQINDNQNSMIMENLNNLLNDEEFLKEATLVGKFVYNYKKCKEQVSEEPTIQVTAIVNN